MNEVINGAITAMVVIAFIFITVSLTTVFGGIAGWIVGLFFRETILNTFNAFGVNTYELSMWQIGATFGFVSGFFKTTKIGKA